ncbi:hypothetical protein [Methanococcus voltae]|uniref:hypothetical protein n=1 Tax=Methanococcus voltae TaxID=2188 RepID=UPI001AE273B8|nr:hypothetical protein [Methanococcus voltae]MBP2173077.1 hypothetical protein [Methanococcus voltae]
MEKDNSVTTINKITLALIGIYGLIVLYDIYTNNSPAFYGYATVVLFIIASQVLCIKK